MTLPRWGMAGNAPNEHMQLTWLTGCPDRPVSVHRRAFGRRGFGSPATQLMRAVRLLPLLAHVSITVGTSLREGI